MTEETLGDVLTRVMLDIIAHQTDPREQAAMLAIMRADGHLPPLKDAA
jgi:hypothetical protein